MIDNGYENDIVSMCNIGDVSKEVS